MWEFLHAYGVWIVVGFLFLLMMRLHGSGGGRWMGYGQHGGQDQRAMRGSHAEFTPPEDAATGVRQDGTKEKTPAGGYSGGCY
ncbi:MAG: hypothetical protein KGJ86_05425 [Chloroflexota bacterium]|nr:hypothetical protein [Chloroflexota bacterium]